MQSPCPQATPSVSFTDDVEIRCVENLTCKYREDLWFVACEMKTFKYSTVLVLQKLGSMNISMVQYAEMEYRGHKVRYFRTDLKFANCTR